MPTIIITRKFPIIEEVVAELNEGAFTLGSDNIDENPQDIQAGTSPITVRDAAVVSQYSENLFTAQPFQEDADMKRDVMINQSYSGSLSGLQAFRNDADMQRDVMINDSYT